MMMMIIVHRWWCTMWVWAQKFKAHIKANISYKPHTIPIENQWKAHAKDIFHTKLIQSFNKNTT